MAIWATENTIASVIINADVEHTLLNDVVNNETGERAKDSDLVQQHSIEHV